MMEKKKMIKEHTERDFQNEKGFGDTERYKERQPAFIRLLMSGSEEI